MNTKQTVDEFYKEDYDALVEYAMNANGWKDTLKLTYEEAVDVIGNMYSYHATHPNKFDAKWVNNSIGQFRSKYVRDSKKIDGLSTIPLEEWHEEGEYEEYDVDEELMFYINKVDNDKHRILLVNHLIRGEPAKRGDNQARKVIKKFRQKMREMYEDGVGW